MNINGHMGGKTEEKSHGEDVTTLKDNPTQPSTDGVGKHHQEKPDKTPENPPHVIQGQNEITATVRNTGEEGHALEADSMLSDKSDKVAITLTKSSLRSPTNRLHISRKVAMTMQD